MQYDLNVNCELGLTSAAATSVDGLVEGDRLHLGRESVGRVPQPALPPARPEARRRRRRRRVQVRRPRDGDILRGRNERLGATISSTKIRRLSKMSTRTRIIDLMDLVNVLIS